MTRLAALALLLMACSPSGGINGLKAGSPSVADADGRVITCEPARDPLNPFIVEWPAQNKTALDVVSQRGVVVVSYAGCTLKVLEDCRAAGLYEFIASAPQSDSIGMVDENEIYANLPLGAAVLKGQLRKGSKLDLKYTTVGQRVSGNPPSMLSGQCKGATHYVRSVTVGSFQLATVANLSASAEANVLGASASGATSGRTEILREGGQECASASDKTKSCVVLQVGLSPLSLGDDGRVATAGFGAGIGALTLVPAVSDLPEQSGIAANLREADVELLRKVQAAKRAEKNPQATAGYKSRAWYLVARHRGGVVADQATARREEWRRVAEAEMKKRYQLARVCLQYSTDTAKLGQLITLDDDVVPPKQKGAYRAELAQVYAPWKDELGKCGIISEMVGAEMIAIAGGTFTMGSKYGPDEEKPPHETVLAPFQLDATEVTVAAYDICVRAGRCSAAGTSEGCNFGKADRGTHAINCVDWTQAVAYCSWVGRRLPSEEEWEFAARGTEGRSYPWGEDKIDSRNVCWMHGPNDGTCPVGSRMVGDTPAGVHDLAGNVSEWTSSRSCAYGNGTCSDLRVHRGGAWNSEIYSALGGARRHYAS